MVFNKILSLSFGLVLFNTNTNAMESNNIINCENNNKLSISKQENFEINSNNITIQSRLNKIEKKIDEILDMQKILSTKISIDNNILQDDMKKLKQDVLVSSSIIESVNKMSSNINTNTKQINNIKKSSNSISNSLTTNRSMNTHMLTTLIEEVYKQKNTLEENKKMICYLINLTHQMFGLSQVFSQSVNCDDNSFQNNSINNINNVINNNIMNTNNIQDDNYLDDCQ